MAFHQINGIKIRTTYEHPPIPVRNFDFSAVDDDRYDGAEDSNCPIGHGATEEDAIEDLLEQMDDTAPMQVDRGFSRETVVMCLVDTSSGIAGQISCIECGGDGDWSKYLPEPSDKPCPCVECKGAGRVYVSI